MASNALLPLIWIVYREGTILSTLRLKRWSKRWARGRAQGSSMTCGGSPGSHEHFLMTLTTGRVLGSHQEGMIPCVRERHLAHKGWNGNVWAGTETKQPWLENSGIWLKMRQLRFQEKNLKGDSREFLALLSPQAEEGKKRADTFPVFNFTVVTTLNTRSTLWNFQVQYGMVIYRHSVAQCWRC